MPLTIQTRTDESGKEWLRCPFCRKKLLRLEEDSEARGVGLWCAGCKCEREMDVTPGENGHEVTVKRALRRVEI